MIEAIPAIAHAVSGAQPSPTPPVVEEMTASLPRADAASAADFAAARGMSALQGTPPIQEVRAQPAPEQGASSSRFMQRLTGVTDYITRLEEQTHRGPPAGDGAAPRFAPATDPGVAPAAAGGGAGSGPADGGGRPAPAADEGAMLDYMSKLYDLHFNATALGEGTKHAVGSVKSLANGGTGS